jgi:transcriptional regulator with XRE-family HTH domain
MRPSPTKKTSLKPGAPAYASVEALMKGEGVSAEVQQAYARLVEDTRITDGLTRLRRSAKLTQTEIAERLSVTQAAVSKIESGRDETLTLAIISAYAAGSKQRINITFGRPLNHVESVKEHALGLKHHLEALAKLAHKDEAIAKGIEGFFQEATVNIDRIVSRCREQLPRSRKPEIRMQTHLAPSPVAR